MNDLIRAFLVRAVTSAGLDDDTIDQIMQQLRYIFDGQTAKEVLEAYCSSGRNKNPPALAVGSVN